LETEFIDLYNKAEANLQQIMGTRNKVAIQSGEGMLALWAALKSCLQEAHGWSSMPNYAKAGW
jgi:aspartate aminotransferase-like enzyme